MIQYNKLVMDINLSKEEYEKALDTVMIRICCNEEPYKNYCITAYVEEEIRD